MMDLIKNTIIEFPIVILLGVIVAGFILALNDRKKNKKKPKLENKRVYPPDFWDDMYKNNLFSTPPVPNAVLKDMYKKNEF